MSARSRVDPGSKARLLSFDEVAVDKRHQAEQLLNEIDSLALLLHEVRRQTDRIEAAADAIGDSILTRLHTGGGSRIAAPARSVLATKSARPKTMTPRSIPVSDAQP